MSRFNSFLGVILSPLKKALKLIAIIAFFVAAGCNLLSSFGNFPGDFFGVIGILFEMVFYVGLIVIIPVLLLVKKEGLAKKFFILFVSFWFVRTIISYFGDFSNVAYFPALFIVAYVFEFLIAIALLFGFVLLVIDEFSEGKEKKFGSIAALLFIGAFALYFFVLLFLIIGYAVNGAPWTMYFDLFSDLAIFAALTAAYLYFADLKIEAPEKKEEAAVSSDKAEATEETAEEPEAAEEPETAEEAAEEPETVEEAAEEPEAAEETAEETEEAPAEQ